METIKVELRAAKIPGLPGVFADHYWLVVIRGIDGGGCQKCDRWEIWQRARLNDCCWGHLHKNLLAPRQGVGNGPSRSIQQWVGDEALPIIERIESSPGSYPFIETYRYWPGPNSNTFAQWIVRDKMKLGMRAVGKSFWIPEIAS